MAESDTSICYSIPMRKALLDDLGGLWIHRGKLIAIKRGKKLYSHPRLLLPRASSRRPSP